MELYQNIFKHRLVISAELQGKYENNSKERKPTRGSKSPLIWILIMDTILSNFKVRDVRVVGYVDDIILLVGGENPGTLVGQMNTALKEVLKWGDKNGFVFIPKKLLQFASLGPFVS